MKCDACFCDVPIEFKDVGHNNVLCVGCHSDFKRLGYCPKYKKAATMSKPSDKAMQVADYIVDSIAGKKCSFFTLGNMDETRNLAYSAIAQALAEQHRKTWAMAIEAAAKAATHLNMDTDEVSGNGYGDGRRDARWKIERLPCPPLETTEEVG